MQLLTGFIPLLVILLHQRQHIQQPHPAQRDVPLVERHRTALQHVSLGAVDSRLETSRIGRHRDSRASDPSESAATGAQDRVGHKEHLRHVSEAHHCANTAHSLPLHTYRDLRGETQSVVHRQGYQHPKRAAQVRVEQCAAEFDHRYSEAVSCLYSFQSVEYCPRDY